MNVTAVKRVLHRHRHHLLLAAIIGCAAFLRYGGFNRPLDAHPDQPRIVNWMNRAEVDGRLKNSVYPGGFFRMFVQFKRMISPFMTLNQEWNYRMGLTDRPLPPENINFKIGRHFNVWLAAATCLLLYLFTVTVTGSAWAGLLAAALLCAVPDHITHAHYVQTDIAMVFMLTFTLYLWAQYAQKRAGWMFALAALAAGYAAGTKYTLLCLAPLGWIYAFYPAPSDPLDAPLTIRWRRILLLLFCATGFFAAGFALASPEVMDWSAFHAGLKWQSQRVYGEGITILGQARGEPFIKLRSHWRALCQTALFNIGPAGLIAGAIGLLIACAPSRRRFWPTLIFFPAVYVYYYLFKAPWVRAQEFMNFLPCWAALTGLAVHYAWRRCAPAPKYLCRTTALILLIATALPIMRAGMMASSIFTWPDTRELANRWMQRHLPPTAAMGIERYTDPAQNNVCQSATFIHKIETSGDFFDAQPKFDFILRNPVSHGRGIRHPLTGVRYPKYQAAFDAFTNRAALLRAWGMPPPNALKSPFSAPDLELWTAAPPHPSLQLRIPLTQPAYISHTGRETFFQAGHDLGAAELLLIDKYPRQLAFGGPNEITTPVFLVANTLERPADFMFKGFGRHIRHNFTPYQAAVFPLHRRVWQPRLASLEIITASVKPEPHITHIPCMLRTAFDAPDAAAILQQTGHARAALDFLLSAPASSAHAKEIAGLLYPLAVANAEWEPATQWRGRAENLRARLREALAMRPDQINVNGINGQHYNQFARIRFVPPNTTFTLDISPDAGRNPEEFPALPSGALLELPARLARGFYTISAQIQPRPCPEMMENRAAAFTVYGCNGKVVAEDTWQSLPNEFFKVKFNLPAGRETAAWLHFTSTVPATLKYRELEIQWDIHDRIRSLYNDLTAARAAHCLRDGDDAGALAMIEQAAPPCWNDLELKRLKLQALRISGAGRDSIAQAAREILAIAPDYWPALEIIDIVAARERPANLAHPVRFLPLLALVGIRKTAAADKNEIALIFEAMDDDLPPLTAVIHCRRRRRWRECLRLSAPQERRLQRGERVVARFDPAEFAGGNALGEPDIGISVCSNVRWSPGVLQPENRRDTIIPISELRCPEPERVASTESVDGSADKSLE